MNYCVIDTGLNGAIIYCVNGKPVDGLTFEKNGRGIAIGSLYKKLKAWAPETIFIEQVFTMPRQSVKATATQWFVVGQIQSVAELACERVEWIPAVRWASFTKRLSATPLATSKQIARELALKFEPEFCSRFTKRKVHDGIADCLCINFYIQRDVYADFIEN